MNVREEDTRLDDYYHVRTQEDGNDGYGRQADGDADNDTSPRNALVDSHI